MQRTRLQQVETNDEGEKLFSAKPESAGPLNRLRNVILLAAFALTALYLIVTHSIPAGLAVVEPEAALSLNADDPAAVIVYARQAITEEANRRQREASTKQEAPSAPPQDAVDLDQVKAMLRTAIVKDPLNARGFTLLGQIALLQNDVKIARRMMTSAITLSPAEWPAADFLMGQSLLANNPQAALYYADLMMRSKGGASSHVPPLLARMAEVPAAQRELAKRLAAAPPWRGSVLGAFGSIDLANPQAPLELLLALKDSPHPPTEAEIAGYINFLLQKKLDTLAYSSWQRFLPPDGLEQVAHLFNGGFERRPSGSPFDWTIGGNSETAVGIFARPDDPKNNALFIRFGQARAAFPTVRQMVVLRPGSYRFSGAITGEILARRGLQWRVTCLEGATAGESKMLIGRFPQWEDLAFDVSIPTDNCAAQYVELIHMARSPSEQLASGTVWFDDLSIARREASLNEPPRDAALSKSPSQ
ncbi:hypothetical protein AMST5_03863 [freshwater sediment metagenome]|uniref:CBM-cenC domain-containing protein n=1 Tax=freshwater sediment metagenome TaxID=556182 RepID=A0AA48RAR3_9ZZZZ